METKEENTQPENEKVKEEEEQADESEPKVDFKPLVQLAEVTVQTHEENEDVLFKMYVQTCFIIFF
jgi:hypothetical protein